MTMINVSSKEPVTNALMQEVGDSSVINISKQFPRCYDIDLPNIDLRDMKIEILLHLPVRLRSVAAWLGLRNIAPFAGLVRLVYLNVPSKM